MKELSYVRKLHRESHTRHMIENRYKFAKTLNIETMVSKCDKWECNEHNKHIRGCTANLQTLKKRAVLGNG